MYWRDILIAGLIYLALIAILLSALLFVVPHVPWLREKVLFRL